MIAGFFVAAALAGQGQTAAVPPEAVAHIRAGMEAQQAGRMTDAIAEFRKVTELAPELPAAFVNLGAAYLQNRDYAAAIPPLEQSVKMDPNLVGAQQMLGYALLTEGAAADALPHLERAGAPDLIGMADLKLGKLPEAVTNLEAALKQHPNDPELLYYLGRASGLLSKQVFDTLVAAYPNSARTHEALGENLAVLRRVPDAEKEYKEALRVQPDLRGAHLALGELYAAASEWPQAEAEFAAEAKLQPRDAETAYRLGSALLTDGKVKEARTELARADRLRPDMPETLYSLGKAASLDGDTAAAVAAWTRLLAVEKDSAQAAQAHFGLAGVYRKQGKTAEAAAEMQQYQAMQAGGKK